jgi:hypothetical protein
MGRDTYELEVTYPDKKRKETIPFARRFEAVKLKEKLRAEGCRVLLIVVPDEHTDSLWPEEVQENIDAWENGFRIKVQAFGTTSDPSTQVFARTLRQAAEREHNFLKYWNRVESYLLMHGGHREKLIFPRDELKIIERAKAKEEKEMSERSDIATRIANFICENNLANPFGGDVEQSKDKRYYGVLFSVPRLLDGFVRVYSPKYILIETQGRLVPQNAVYESEENALKFMRLAYVEHNTEAAYAVPTKAPKEK